jgi:amino-acid N-acetyltransferase
MSITHKIVSNETEFGSFQEAVKNAGLPHQDLNYQNQVLISYFDNQTMVGTGGLEVVNNVGLLRSVCFQSTARNQSIGKQITNDILATARQSNLGEVYLLTETAKDYFRKLGFEEIHREAVPEEIKSTTEFASVCPASAVCMRLKLKPE